MFHLFPNLAAYMCAQWTMWFKWYEHNAQVVATTMECDWREQQFRASVAQAMEGT